MGLPPYHRQSNIMWAGRFTPRKRCNIANARPSRSPHVMTPEYLGALRNNRIACRSCLMRSPVALRPRRRNKFSIQVAVTGERTSVVPARSWGRLTDTEDRNIGLIGLANEAVATWLMVDIGYVRVEETSPSRHCGK